MSSKEQISSDIKDAMRAKDKPKLDLLRFIMAAVKQVEVDERIEVDDERLTLILDKMQKQRRESISQYQAANRQDLVVQEEFELALIQQYLPTALTEEEIILLVESAISNLGASKISDMGKVMAELKPKMQGRADMSLVSSLIKAKLN